MSSAETSGWGDALKFWVEPALLVLLVFAAVLPFSGRAVFADEHIYLKLAHSALEHPLFPADTPLLFFGIQRPNYSGHTHPPVGEYALAGIELLLGRFREIPYRLTFALFSVIAALSFYSLARRFTSDAFFVSVLFCVSPSFFVMAPTLMMDVPLLAFLLAGAALYFRGKLLPAALCFTCALGTGYSALVPLVCLGLMMLVARRPLREFTCVAAPPAILLLWLLAMTLHFGEFPLTQTATYLAQQGVQSRTALQLVTLRLHSAWSNTLATLSFLGGVLVFPGTLRLARKYSLMAAFGLATLLSFLTPADSMPTLLYRLWYIALAGFGIMVLAAFCGAASRTIRSSSNGGESLWILWAPAVLVFFIVVGEMVTARYLLLAMPALYLILFRETSRSDLIATIVPTLVLSIVLATGDAAFVNSYRAWVNTTVPQLQQQGFQVYGAAESGLRFYLEQSGVPMLTSNDRRPVGSNIIVRQTMFGYSLGEDIEVVLTDLRRFSLEGSFPLRTYGPKAHAGFWDSHFGIVPYVVSAASYDDVVVTQVNPLVRQLPQGSTDSEQNPVYSPDGPAFKLLAGERVFPMKVPSNVQIQYDLVGGPAEVRQTPEGLKLVNSSAAPVEWRRLRLTPLQWTTNQ